MLLKNNYKIFRVVLLVAIILLNVFLASSQTEKGSEPQRDGPRMRPILAETYSKNRTNPTPKPRTTNVTRKKTINNKKIIKEVTTIEEVASLGFTLWNLVDLPKEEQKRIVGIKGTVSKEDIENKEFVAQRVEGNPLIVEDGAKVRFSIELPTNGYLYVFDREVYKDNTYSTPYLIYPVEGINKVEDDNYIKAYELVFLPRQQKNYIFTLTKGEKGNIVAEEFTLVISPRPLDLKAISCFVKEDKQTTVVECQPREIQKEEFDFESKLKEWKGDFVVSEFNLKKTTHLKHKLMDKAEILALENKSNKLTQNAPPPQSVYTILRKPNEPYWVSIPVYIRH